VKHQNIIHCLSAWALKENKKIVFITELVTGGSLRSYLRKKETPRLKVVKQWCQQILSALAYLHNMEPHSIIHRDLKCDNVLINSNNSEIKIGDLGLATVLENTKATSLVGTPEFMAPELYDEDYDTSVDI